MLILKIKIEDCFNCAKNLNSIMPSGYSLENFMLPSSNIPLGGLQSTLEVQIPYLKNVEFI